MIRMKLDGLKVCATVSSLLFAASPSWGKTVNTYGVSVQVQNTAMGGSQAPEYMLMAAGLTCTSSLGITETESILGKQGQKENHTFSSASDFSLTVIGQPQKQTQVTVNPDNDNPTVSVEVSENCFGSLPKVTTCDDGNGHTSICTKTETVNMPMHWQCDIPASQLPKSGSSSLQCNPPNDDALLGALINSPQHAVLLNYLHSKKITINSEFQGTKELYRNYNCPDNTDLAHLNPDLAKILHVEGGIKTGSFATNNMQYSYSINGGPQVEKNRADGITNFDILYCKKSSGEPINLSMSAQYGNHSVPAAQAVFDGSGVGQQTMHFQTKGSDWGSQDSQVTVQMKSAGGQ